MPKPIKESNWKHCERSLVEFFPWSSFVFGTQDIVLAFKKMGVKDRLGNGDVDLGVRNSYFSYIN